MGDSPLPEGWSEHVDPNTNHKYYISAVTGKSQWERPTAPAASVACYPPWEPKLDTNTNRTYFYNTKTGESLWELPPQPAAEVATPATAQPAAAAVAAAATTATATRQSSATTTTAAATQATTATTSTPATRAAAAATTTSSLPPGWEEKFDASSGHNYYVNQEKGITQWERPTATATPAASPATQAKAATPQPAAASAKAAGPADDSSGSEEEDPPLVIFRPDPLPNKKVPKKGKDKGTEPTEPDMSSTQHKLVVIGAGAVGKSALVVRFIKGDFIAEYDPTIEDSYRRQFMVDERPCHLDILDTAGQEEYSALRDNYMRTGQGFLVVFAVNSRGSFAEIPGFVKHIHEVKDLDEVPLVVIGSKCDLRPDVPQRVINDFCTKNQTPFIPCSAKANINVETVFIEVVKECRRLAPAKAGPDGHKKCLIL